MSCLFACQASAPAEVALSCVPSLSGGTNPSLVLLTLARKLASVTLAMWRKGELYGEKKLKLKHAV
ncbi:MAG: hypothetical protein H6Q33_4806 [Deltaproteobacteria bacterium]|nr:hypothetical protein [Deltaproteobacteria bacterium]